MRKRAPPVQLLIPGDALTRRSALDGALTAPSETGTKVVG